MVDQRPYVTAALAGSLYRSQKALTFDGVSDFMFVPVGFQNTFPIPRNVPSSVSIWVKYQGPASPTPMWQTIMSRWWPNPVFSINEGGWRAYIFSGAASGNPFVTRGLWVQLSTAIFSGIWVYTKTSFPLDTWTHVCFTWDGNASPGVAGLHVYVDGVDTPYWIVTNTWASNAINSNSFSHLLWGMQYSSWFPGGGMPDNPPVVGAFFEGIMDETSLWRFELSATEVLALYHCGYPISPKMVGLPAGKNIDTHFRMGEFTDGTPFVLGFSVCFGRYPVAGTVRNAFWNNDSFTPPVRVTTDTPP